MAAQQVVEDLEPRLRAARRAVVDAREHLGVELRTRDGLIVAAVDEGMQQRAVARAAGVSYQRVTAILIADQEGVTLGDIADADLEQLPAAG